MGRISDLGGFRIRAGPSNSGRHCASIRRSK
jgi:hypothetical protein